MVKVKFDVIQKVMEATNASFEDADRAVRKSKGDFDGAVYFVKQRQSKGAKDKTFASVIDNIIGIFKYKLVVKRDDKIYVSVSTGIVAIILLIYVFFASMYRASVGFLFAFLIGICMYAKTEILLVPPVEETKPIELKMKDDSKAVYTEYKAEDTVVSVKEEKSDADDLEKEYGEIEVE